MLGEGVAVAVRGHVHAGHGLGLRLLLRGYVERKHDERGSPPQHPSTSRLQFVVFLV
jgi:hypothetical protein